MVTIIKDLRACFAGARDQEQRPTCLAFALSDAHAADRLTHPVFSADYLYYHGLRRMPVNHGDNGVGLVEASEALRSDGQPLEKDWPYSPVLPVDLASWKPPPKLRVMHATATAIPANFSAICATLDLDRSIVVIFQPTERFYFPDRSGFLAPRTPDPALPQLHAVVAVGHGQKGGQRHVLIRNSWSTGWGQDGHAWLTEDYLSPRLSSLASIKGN
jgi:hypothetical protein